MPDMRASVRINGANPRHHLYWNNGTWWMHYTVHLADYTKRRVRRSLRTRDLETAKARRDAILRQLREVAMSGAGMEAVLAA